jgi:hypothetical protein
MGSLTVHNNFFMPDPEDSMSDVEKNISNNFRAIEDAASLEIFNDLPGDMEEYYDRFNLGDRIFVQHSALQNTSYILVAKNLQWGLIWRPIQAAIGIWKEPPNAITHPDWQSQSANPMQFALCNRGKFYLRGTLSLTTGTIPENTSITLLAPLPVGARPSNEFHQTLGFFPMGPRTNNVFRGARIFVSRLGVSSFRFWGVTTTNQVFLEPVSFSIGGELYFNP